MYGYFFICFRCFLDVDVLVSGYFFMHSLFSVQLLYQSKFIHLLPSSREGEENEYLINLLICYLFCYHRQNFFSQYIEENINHCPLHYPPLPDSERNFRFAFNFKIYFLLILEKYS